MPTRVIFRCEFRELAFGTYLDMPPGGWLVWHGGGPLGPRRYACRDHRGELTAYLREHYGTIAPHPWKMPPYPTSSCSADTERAIRHGGLSSMPKWGLP